MTTCRRATELISAELDTALPFHNRVALGFHTIVCGACRRYQVQIGAVEEAVEEFFASAKTFHITETLPLESKEHLKSVVKEHLDGNA